ncbi:MAG TPA: hypothetical protein VFA69_08200 [Candidatus Nitrosotalea sp.]|nr:hypothetical protein [Candidatus Nitrosotalea sp.]
MEENKTNRNGKGRPSKPEQLEIERTLRPLFMRGLSVYAAADKTGYSINTVKKYYRNFYKEARNMEGQDFAQECKDRIVSTCLGIDREISKLEKIREEIELKSQNSGAQYIQLCKLRINLSDSISDLHMKRLGIANSPTYDEMLAALKKIREQK